MRWISLQLARDSREHKQVVSSWPGLDPAIYVFASKERKQDVDHRDKPGDDAAMRSCSITGALEYWITRFRG